MLAKAPYLIGIDAGTSVIKAVLFNSEGREICSVSERVPVITGNQNTAEQDMEHVWLAVKNTVKKIIEMNNNVNIAVLGITGQGDGCWLIDQHGEPVRRAILWSDGRAASIVNRWQAEGITKKVWETNGTVLFPGSQAPIIKWLDEHELHTLQKARWSLYCKDWIAYKLTGIVATEETDASRQFFDIYQRRYSDELIYILGLQKYKSLIPEILPTGSVRGYLKSEPAEEMGLPSGLPVVAGPFDVVACALGLGCIEEFMAFTILGTTIFNGVTLNKPFIQDEEAGMNICHSFPNKWLRGMPLMSGTPNIDWFIDNMGYKLLWEAKKRNLNIYQYLDEQIATVPPGSWGVLYHPYISPAGERAPFVKSSARAQFIGLSLLNNTSHLVRAVYEGLSYAIRDCYEDVLNNIKEIRLCGGGAKSSVWPQIVADVTGKTACIPEGTEFGAKGAALNAGAAIGIYNSLKNAVHKTMKLDRKYQPNIENHKTYEALYHVFRITRNNMLEIWDALQEASN